MVAGLLLVDVAVVVPAAVVHEDEAGAGIGPKQVARENHRVAERAGAIAGAVVVADCEDARDARVVHDSPRAPVVLVIAGEATVGVGAVAERAVELPQALPPALQRFAYPIARDRVRRPLDADAHVHRAELRRPESFV